MSITLVLGQFLIGLSLSASLFLIASGLTIIFGLLRVVNFAHGSFYALGAYFCYTVVLATNNFWLGLVISVILLMAVGAIVELGLLRRIYGHEHIYQLLLTYSLILIFTDIIEIIWGPFPVTTPLPLIFSGSTSFLGSLVPTYCFFLIGLGAAVAVGLWALLYRTKLGAIIRTSAFDKEMTSVLGVNVPRLYTLVFILGAGLGGLGGATAAPMITIIPDMGTFIIIESFVVIVIGGVGSLLGAVVGSLVIGVWAAIGLLIVPQFAMVFTFALMGIVLIIWPRGLFGKEF